MKTNSPPRSGAATSEVAMVRDAHKSEPNPNEDQQAEFRPLVDRLHKSVKRAVPYRLAILAHQLLNYTMALGAVLLIVFALHKVVEVLL